MANISLGDIHATLNCCGSILLKHEQHLTDLDQEIGDGDMGITMAKIAGVLTNLDAEIEEKTDIGVFLGATGMAANRKASSTMGTLMATAFMRAGKELRGKTALTPLDISNALVAAVEGIQHRGKASLGDKTIVDALHPAAMAFQAVIEGGGDLASATRSAALAAKEGCDKVTPLRSKIGRAGWVGERTEGKVDPGCDMAAIVLAEYSQIQMQAHNR